MCSDPLDPGGEVRGCSVGCTLCMSDISPLRVAAALNVHRGFPELKKMHLQAGVFWVRIVFFSFYFFFFVCIRPDASMRPACLIDLSTSNEAVFFLS